MSRSSNAYHAGQAGDATNWQIRAREYNVLRDGITKRVEALALRSLSDHGYYGLVPMLHGAPDTYADLVDFRLIKHDARSFPVYSGHSDKSMYTSPAVNMLARAWHDLTHLDLGADFSYEDECLVGVAQASCLTGIYAQMMLADTLGQAAYKAYTGCYVEDQARFVLDYLNYGEGHAVCLCAAREQHYRSETQDAELALHFVA